MRFLSLFSGIEAASCAWIPLGWEAVAFAEVEPFPCAVLSHHYHGVPNLGDVTAITESDIVALGPIDVVVFGFPCQDLSVAGQRRGLAGERSGLFYDAARIVRWAGARWAIAENVPGLFSSSDGRDFTAVVSTLVGCDFDVPVNGWRNTGAVLGPNGLLEWSVLDAQYFGLAQRRKRVFFVLDTGNWADRPPVLFERDCLSWNPAPRRETGEDVAGTFKARARSGGWGQDVDLAAGGYMQVAHTLGSRYDSSEDGCGRGTPLVPVVVGTLSDGAHNGGGLNGQDAYTGRIIPVIGFHNRQDPDVSGELTHPLGAKDNEMAVAFAERGSNVSIDGDCAATMKAAGDNTGGRLCVAFAQNTRNEVREMPYAGALAAEPGAKQQSYVRQAMSVRRLTPEECEKLQGFLPGYTAVPYRNKPAADGPRYKALGNSMAVPVMAWIGRRIAAVQKLTAEK